MSLAASSDGKRLTCSSQKLEGYATPEGLWIQSTERGAEGRLHLVACVVRRQRVTDDSASAWLSNFEFHAPFTSILSPSGGTGIHLGPEVLAQAGSVSVEKNWVRFTRRHLIEQYSVNVDGVQQDFLVTERPAGTGDLCVELLLSGARAKATTYGAKLALEGSGRELAYGRLRAEDAKGRELSARLEVLAPGLMAVRVTDAHAVYPIRIDPTFSDADWVALNPGMQRAGDHIKAILVDGSGNVYVGGKFNSVGTVSATNIAKWDGSVWSPLGSGLNGDVMALAEIGTNLYAGGFFTAAGGVTASHVAKWDGTTWSPLGSGVSGSYGYVDALAVDGTNLYVAGSFATAGEVQANSVARWDGNVWADLDGGVDGNVFALLVNGTNLFVAGGFTTAGGIPAYSIASWDGNAWRNLGEYGDSAVCALATSGTNLYAGGDFTTLGGTKANYIARWDGNIWSTLGAGVEGIQYSGVPVLALAVSGNALYVGGYLTNVGGVQANFIAKWDGNAWSTLGSGLNGPVFALATDSAGHLFVGGSFSLAGMNHSPCVAQANIGVPPWPPPGGIAQDIRVDGGSVTLDFLGVPGAVYVVQRATDASFAQNLMTLLITNAPPGGLFRCTDSDAPNVTAFYRLLRQ